MKQKEIVEEKLLGMKQALEEYFLEKHGISKESTAKGFNLVIQEFAFIMANDYCIEILEKLKFRSYENQDGRPDYVLVTQIDEMQEDLRKY
jgi:hypothetical protein